MLYRLETLRSTYGARLRVEVDIAPTHGHHTRARLYKSGQVGLHSGPMVFGARLTEFRTLFHADASGSAVSHSTSRIVSASSHWGSGECLGQELWHPLTASS